MCFTPLCYFIEQRIPAGADLWSETVGGEKLVAICSWGRCNSDLPRSGPPTPRWLEHTSRTPGASSLWQGGKAVLRFHRWMNWSVVRQWLTSKRCSQSTGRGRWQQQWERGCAVLKAEAMRRCWGPERFCFLWLLASCQVWDLPDWPQPAFKTKPH